MRSAKTSEGAKAKQRFRVVFLVINFFLWAIPFGIFVYLPYRALNQPLVTEFSLGYVWVAIFILTVCVLLYAIGLFGYVTGMRMTRTRFKAYIGLAAIALLSTAACLGCVLYYNAYTNNPDYQAFWQQSDKKELQFELSCCGYDGVTYYDNTTIPTPVSCYDEITGALYTVGCSTQTAAFAQEITTVLVTLIVLLFVIQVLGTSTAAVILKKLQARDDDAVLWDQAEAKVKQTYKIIALPHTKV